VKVYLAGPIFGCTDQECKAWRREATRLLRGHGHEALNPMDRDYRGREDGSAAVLVNDDLKDLYAADAMLVNAERPTWGTAMEIAYFARSPVRRTPAIVHAFGAPDPASPWLRAHARLHPTLFAAVEALA
jgi:nucleoside 2-deoxyribosyltransferase